MANNPRMQRARQRAHEIAWEAEEREQRRRCERYDNRRQQHHNEDDYSGRRYSENSHAHRASSSRNNGYGYDRASQPSTSSNSASEFNRSRQPYMGRRSNEYGYEDYTDQDTAGPSQLPDGDWWHSDDEEDDDDEYNRGGNLGLLEYPNYPGRSHPYYGRF